MQELIFMLILKTCIFVSFHEYLLYSFLSFFYRIRHLFYKKSINLLIYFPPMSKIIYKFQDMLYDINFNNILVIFLCKYAKKLKSILKYSNTNNNNTDFRLRPILNFLYMFILKKYQISHENY